VSVCVATTKGIDTEVEGIGDFAFLPRSFHDSKTVCAASSKK